MNLYVPDIGDRLQLEADWTFDLFYERRNKTLLEHFGFTFSHRRDGLEKVSLPKGTVLKVDRIYIRKGDGFSDFSSISFYAEKLDGKKSPRFWAKLSDCNKIVFKFAGADINRKLEPLYFGYVPTFLKRETVTQYGSSHYREGMTEGPNMMEYNVICGRGYSRMKVAYRVTVTFNLSKTLIPRKQQGWSPIIGKKIVDWNVERKNLKYKVTEISTGENVGEWGSFATMKKHVREHWKSKLTQ